MRIVVTGASGFLGAAVMQGFSQSEHEVIGVSRSPVVEPFMVQVHTYNDTPKGDVLIHLAETRERGVAAALGEPYLRQTSDTLHTLTAKGYQHIVYASSAVVYGDRSAEFHHIDDLVIAPDIYAQAKLAGEDVVRRAGGLVVRLANLYGPGMAEANVVSTILGQIPGHGPLEVRDDQPSRDFVWVEDAARALVLMSQTPRSGIYNVGSGIGTTIGQLARLSLDLAGQGDRPVVARAPSNRGSWTVLDISKSTADFGWRPMTTLADGIQQLLAVKDRCHDAN